MMTMRPATLAGEFYPANKKELSMVIDKFLSQASPPKIMGEVFGLLLPHAGYDFSGKVAAYGFKAIAGYRFDTAILLGDSHYEYFDGVSFWPAGFWQTPLGKVAIDGKLASKILPASKRFFQRDSAHLFEHSLEVQLPFLQKVLKNFKIIPIIFGSENKDWQALAKAILENIKGKKVLIIASSDLSHRLPHKKAKKIDRQTLKSILGLKLQNHRVCAKDSLKTLLAIAKKLKAKTHLLKYVHSKVGYGAVAFYK